LSLILGGKISLNYSSLSTYKWLQKIKNAHFHNGD